MNVNKRALSLAVSFSVFNFNSRNSKQTLIVFDLQYKINFTSKQTKISFI